MKTFFTFILTLLGLTSACGQQSYENVDVNQFAEMISDTNVVLIDVRTDSEYNEGHLANALNLDQAQDDFIEKSKAALSIDKTIAVYCRSGRRSANAAEKLAIEGYRCVNLNGGIIAWKDAGKPVTSGLYEMDEFLTQRGKVVKFYALVHASIRLEYDGKEIMIDPVTRLGDKIIDYSGLPKADYIIVTHEHGDHFDKEAIKKLSKVQTQLVMNKRCSELYGTGSVLNNGDKIQLADNLLLEAVPAYNYSEGHTQFHPQGRDNGYVLSIDGLRIYIAGDTEDIPEMSELKDIDIAFLPCNQPYTMTIEQLVRAAMIIKPKVLFPYHYGRTDVTSISRKLEGMGIDVKIRHYE